VGCVAGTETGVFELPVVAGVVVSVEEDDVSDVATVVVDDLVALVELPLPHAAVSTARSRAAVAMARIAGTVTRKGTPGGAPFTLAGFAPAVVRRLVR